MSTVNNLTNKFDLEKYLSDGIEALIKNALKISIKNPKQSAFFVRFGIAAKKAAKRRHDRELLGEHIPSFLIASVTEDCNLQCTGCYSHARHTCHKSQELSACIWERIFEEAYDLGVSVIILAGGETLLRKDVLNAATKYNEILFPVFTNGTLLDEEVLSLFDNNRNLVPIISIEGDEITTDLRRGKGVHKQTLKTMYRLREYGIMFGVSITVSADNLKMVTSEEYISELKKTDCKAVLFVEYVPVDLTIRALDENERKELGIYINSLREKQEEMIIISFPGDEAESGGCLAAGRGFVHINASGGVEPCPFSPYSELNLKEVSLSETLNSPLFAHLSKEGILTAKHTGGCVLFEQKEAVERLMKPKVYEFDAVIKQSDICKGGAYIMFPYDIRSEFGKGRVKVHATFNGEPYDGSIVNMGVKNPDGSVCYIIGITKDIREKIGKNSNEVVQVTVCERE